MNLKYANRLPTSRLVIRIVESQVSMTNQELLSENEVHHLEYTWEITTDMSTLNLIRFLSNN